MKWLLAGSVLLSILVCEFAEAVPAKTEFAGKRKLNSLVRELLEVSSIEEPGDVFVFSRPTAGWMFVSANCQGNGNINIMLDKAPKEDAIIVHGADDGLSEAVRHVAKGRHKIRVECDGQASVERLVVRAIPELLHCGLFDPAIKSYGHYDMDFP